MMRHALGYLTGLHTDPAFPYTVQYNHILYKPHIITTTMVKCSYCNRWFAASPDGRLAMTFHHIWHVAEAGQ